MCNSLRTSVIVFCVVLPAASLGQSTVNVDSVLVLGQTLVRSPVDLLSECAGQPVTASVLGRVVGANSPIVGLPFDDPGYEFTFTITDLEYVACALWDGGDPIEYGGISYRFENGMFRLYRDSSPDADLLNPETYADGDILLEGPAGYMTGMTSCPYCPWENYAWITFSGGLLFSSVSHEGTGYSATLVHQQSAPPDSALMGMGYQFPSTGWMDLHAPVGIESTTWGRIKNLYR
jgi:hypothetical protein